MLLFPQNTHIHMPFETCFCSLFFGRFFFRCLPHADRAHFFPCTDKRFTSRAWALVWRYGLQVTNSGSKAFLAAFCMAGMSELVADVGGKKCHPSAQLY